MAYPPITQQHLLAILVPIVTPGLLICQALGAALVAEPYSSSAVLGATLLQALGDPAADALLEGLAEGQVRLAVAALEPRFYAVLLQGLEIDPADAHLAGAVAEAGMRPLVVPSVMSSPHVAAEAAGRWRCRRPEYRRTARSARAPHGSRQPLPESGRGRDRCSPD